MKNTRIVVVMGVVVLLTLACLGGCRAGMGVERGLSGVERLENDVRVLSVEFAQRNAEHRGVLNDAGVWIGRRLG
ncbi:MAG: hypothetical protein JKY95_00075, partial [Planctomycetaceae bacterium]|nr:hypothetical protein [Planctomycetaceae bacterium]